MISNWIERGLVVSRYSQALMIQARIYHSTGAFILQVGLSSTEIYVYIHGTDFIEHS